MINGRLLKLGKEGHKYIGIHVFCQWLALLANIGIMFQIAGLLEQVFMKSGPVSFLNTGLLLLAFLMVRAICVFLTSRMAFQASQCVKKNLRHRIYEKLLVLGSGYTHSVQTSQIVQVATEGVDQLETYFGNFLPQFFYAILAPLTLFAVISSFSLLCAVVLLICVPLIPISIVVVQRWAKKLLSKYWGQYTALGDTFLENLQGMTTLKIYQADAYKQEKMEEEAEHFRKITMRVLTMQLNSITVMDLVAYGGTALGIILALSQFHQGVLTLSECIVIILLCADFFLPMRLLGSFFHIAMNGMAASEKIFALLDLPEHSKGDRSFPSNPVIQLEDISFSYTEERRVLQDVSMSVRPGQCVSIVGESGCGKSTLASVLMGKNQNEQGQVTIGKVPLLSIREEERMKNMTYVSHQSVLFKGTVRENLRMAKENVSEDVMWDVLKKVNLADFIKGEQGLDTMILESGSNLSGGQRQRLALARAILHDSPIYIFDEATSNIDVESEQDIVRVIFELAKTKTVIMIAHRLANVIHSQRIYCMDNGRIVESGTHEQLLNQEGLYANMWHTQQNLEQLQKEG